MLFSMFIRYPCSPRCARRCDSSMLACLQAPYFPSHMHWVPKRRKESFVFDENSPRGSQGPHLVQMLSCNHFPLWRRQFACISHSFVRAETVGNIHFERASTAYTYDASCPQASHKVVFRLLDLSPAARQV